MIGRETGRETDRQLDRQTHREIEDCHINVETGMEVLLLKVKQCLGLPDPGKSKEESSPRGSRESMTLPTP